MEPQVIFYRLSRKIVNNQDAIPEEPRQVLYYSLALGHHVGVMDCLSEAFRVPARSYRAWLDRLPDGEARRKMEGALRWTEIEVNRSHVEELLPALQKLLPANADSDARWISSMIECLQEMVAEPAFYLMGRLRS